MPKPLTNLIPPFSKGSKIIKQLSAMVDTFGADNVLCALAAVMRDKGSIIRAVEIEECALRLGKYKPSGMGID